MRKEYIAPTVEQISLTTDKSLMQPGIIRHSGGGEVGFDKDDIA